MCRSSTSTLGRVLGDRGARGGEVAGLGDDLEAGLGVEQHPEAGAHDCMVVGDDDGDRGHRPTVPAGKRLGKRDCRRATIAAPNLTQSPCEALDALVELRRVQQREREPEVRLERAVGGDRRAGR